MGVVSTGIVLSQLHCLLSFVTTISRVPRATTEVLHHLGNDHGLLLPLFLYSGSYKPDAFHMGFRESIFLFLRWNAGPAAGQKAALVDNQECWFSRSLVAVNGGDEKSV